jgi:hypothetical protein
MDPNAALNYLIDALTEGRTEDAGEIFDTIVVWIDGGGFPPSDPRL